MHIASAMRLGVAYVAGMFVLVSLICCPAQAAEGVTLAGPIGGADINSASLPPPGLWGGFALATLYGTRLTGDNGKSISPDYSFLPKEGGAAVAGLLYVYNTEILGGRIATSFLDSYSGNTCLKISARVGNCAAGFNDAYSDLFFWSRLFPSAGYVSQSKASGPPIPFGLTVGFGLGLGMPIGQYNAKQAFNQGTNLWDFAPNFALTYTLPGIVGDATELSTRVFWNQYLRNSATDYLTGPILDTTFAATERFGAWQVGLAGDYFRQMKDDNIGGVIVQPNGKRIASLTLGPLLSYSFIAANRPWNIKAKAIFDTYSKNAAGTNRFILVLSTKFY